MVGAGFLAKFTNGVQILCFGLFLLGSKEHRHLLFSRGLLVFGASFTAASLPILWWNLETGWIHVAAVSSRSGARDSFGLHPMELLRFCGEVFGVVSPLFMAGIVTAGCFLLAAPHRHDPRIRLLLSQSLPLYALFLLFSLNKAGKSNWVAPALVISLIFTVVWWRGRIAQQPRWRWAVGAAFALALAMSAIIHGTGFLHLPPSMDPLRRSQGWADFGAHVQAARLQHGTELLLGNHYSQASMMAFYLPDHPRTYLPPEPYGKSQFTLWPGYPLRPATRALFVTNSMRGTPQALQDQFSQIELVDDFVSQHEGRPMTRFRIYLCQGARIPPDAAAEMPRH